MDATAVPFARLIGLRRNATGQLELPFSAVVHNHLGTVHASAQIALAETASGDLLVHLFPEWVGKVVPIVREARAKFRKPATGTLTAHPAIADELAGQFREQMDKKGHASLTIEVELLNREGEVTCRAAFDWFIQRIDNRAN
jgi:acyl-coenzyme A thioesterase PaaI-like protein